MRRQPDGTGTGTGAAAAFVVVVTSIVLQVLAMDPLVGAYDEGLILYAASQVRDGAWPYRDFWTLYTPGSFYLLAALFDVFGESVLVGRAFDVASRTAIVLLAFHITSRLGSRAAAWAAAAATLVILIVVQEYEFPVFPACATALLAIALLHASLTSRSQWPAFGAGAALGATLLIRHDLGAAAAVAGMVLLIVAGPQADASERRALRRSILPALGGLALVVLPCVAVLLARVPLHDLHENLVRIPLEVYAAARSLPFPSIAAAIEALLNWQPGGKLLPLVVYAPPLILVAVALLRHREITGAQGTDPASRHTAALLAGLLTLGVLFFLKGVVRVSPAHMAPALVVTAILLAASIADATSRGRRAALVGIALVGLGLPLASSLVSLAKAAASTAVALATGSHTSRGDVPRALCAQPAVPRLRCFRTAPDRAAVARYLLEHTPQGRTIYVGAGRHDKLLMNDVILYFLADRAAATRWHDLHPGVQTTAVIQREMIAELERRRPAWVVLNAQWDDVAEPNESARSSGVRLLDEHLSRAYRPVRRQGSFTVLAPAPTSP